MSGTSKGDDLVNKLVLKLLAGTGPELSEAHRVPLGSTLVRRIMRSRGIDGTARERLRLAEIGNSGSPPQRKFADRGYAARGSMIGHCGDFLQDDRNSASRSQRDHGNRAATAGALVLGAT